MSEIIKDVAAQPKAPKRRTAKPRVPKPENNQAKAADSKQSKSEVAAPEATTTRVTQADAPKSEVAKPEVAVAKVATPAASQGVTATEADSSKGNLAAPRKRQRRSRAKNDPRNS